MRFLFMATMLFFALAGPAAAATSWEEDLDGDGRKETKFRDDDGDGNPDSAAVDRDGDGFHEEYWVDADDDGDWDRVWFDNDRDGDWERGLFDDDGDGSFELEWIDDNGDGKIDPDTGEIRREGPPVPNDGPRPKLPVEARAECNCLAVLPTPELLLDAPASVPINEPTRGRNIPWLWIAVVAVGLIIAVIRFLRKKDTKPPA